MEREYYFDLETDGIHPDEEAMAAFLLDEGILFISWATEQESGKKVAALCLNVNDYFVPASDGELVGSSDIPIVYKLYKENEYDGILEYVSKRRGIKNEHWREKFKTKE